MTSDSAHGAFEPLRPGTYGIDPASGAIMAREGTVTPAMSKTQFLTASLFVDGDWTNESAGWYSARSKLLHFDGEELGASVMFEHEEMRFVSLRNNDPAYGTSWDDYTDAKEQERDARHLRWLTTISGGWDRPFPWGRIYCGIDSRSDGATIIVKYDRAWSRLRGIYQRLRGSLHR